MSLAQLLVNTFLAQGCVLILSVYGPVHESFSLQYQFSLYLPLSPQLVTLKLIVIFTWIQNHENKIKFLASIGRNSSLERQNISLLSSSLVKIKMNKTKFLLKML